MPELQKLANEYEGRGVVLLTAILGTSPSRASATAAKLGVTAPILLADGAFQRIMRVDAVPWTILIDQHGKPVQAWRGAHERSTFEAAIKKRL